MSLKIRQIAKGPDHTTMNAMDEVNTRFMTLVQYGEAGRYAQPGDSSDSGTISSIQDECVFVSLAKGTSYYFHGQIKRTRGVQNFTIKLVKNNDQKAQFIKKITVAAVADADSEYMDVDFIFTAAADFDAIVFELARTTGGMAAPIIVYQELSTINNILNGDIAVKMGIQSKPGLLMCINGQEIRIGKSGIYEMRNGVVKATQFSVVSPALDELYPEYIDQSICLFHNNKYRSITPFTLDYMYEVEED
jgi:hypothetical protein